jgi:hypothetical protein
MPCDLPSNPILAEKTPGALHLGFNAFKAATSSQRKTSQKARTKFWERTLQTTPQVHLGPDLSFWVIWSGLEWHELTYLPRYQKQLPQTSPRQARESCTPPFTQEIVYSSVTQEPDTAQYNRHRHTVTSSSTTSLTTSSQPAMMISSAAIELFAAIQYLLHLFKANTALKNPDIPRGLREGGSSFLEEVVVSRGHRFSAVPNIPVSLDRVTLRKLDSSKWDWVYLSPRCSG